jgi:hypothetical protein
MNIDDKRAFLCALRDVMIRHGVTSMGTTYDGEIYIGGIEGQYDLCDLGTIAEIDEEIKNL